jgi:hypothetical protein
MNMARLQKHKIALCAEGITHSDLILRPRIDRFSQIAARTEATTTHATTRALASGVTFSFHSNSWCGREKISSNEDAIFGRPRATADEVRRAATTWFG